MIPALRTETRILGPEDAGALAAVFRSREKLMLRAKNERQRALGERFPAMLAKDCEGWGTFSGRELQAFCIFYPWREMPFSTLVLIQSRPSPGPVSFARNGLAPCLDAALESLEARGYSHIVYRRIVDPKWRKDALLKDAGRVADYSYTVAETIKAGATSRWDRFNRAVLDSRPVDHDTAIVIGAKPGEPA
jgi:hypothetical protein